MVPIRPSRARPSVLRGTPLARLKRRLPRERLKRNPFLARAGGGTVGGPLPGGRVTRGLALLISIFLILAICRQYTLQTLDVSVQVNRVVRGQVIPELEKQFKIKIEAGDIESDWLGRVVLNDVLIEPDTKLPTGALARAKSITLSLDLFDLALKRKTALEALHSVALQQPQLYLYRDPKRAWNFDRFLKGPKSKTPFEWLGTVTWTDGRVYLLDEILRNANGKPLLVDANDIDGNANFVPKQPVLVHTTIGRTLLGEQQMEVEPVAASASYDIQAHSLATIVDLKNAPVPFATDYLLPKRQARVTSGTASGTLQITWRDGKLAPHGNVQLNRLAGVLPLIKGLNRGQQVPVHDLSGPLAFSGLAFTSPGLSAVAAGIPVRLRGDVAIPAAKTWVFDLQAAAASVDHRRLLALLPPHTLPFNLEARPLQLNAAITGDFSRWTATGTGVIPAVAASSPKVGRARANLARLAFAVSQDGKATIRAAARYALTGVTAALKQGNGTAAGAEGMVRYTGGAVQIETAVRSWSASTAKYGSVSGPQLQLNASAPKGGSLQGTVFFRGADTRNVRLAAISPAAKVVRRTGTVDASLRFWNLGGSKPTISGPVRLASAVVEEPNFGTHNLREARGQLLLSNGALRLSNLHAQSDLGPLSGEIYAVPGAAPRVLLTASDLRVPASTLNTVLAPRGLTLTGAARGTVSVTSAPKVPGALEARFKLALPENTLQTGKARNALLRTSTLQGIGHYDPASGAWNAAATLEAGLVTFHSGRLGRTALLIPKWLNGVRAANLRVALAASGKRTGTPQLSGRAGLDRLALPGLPLPGANAGGFTVRDISAIFETERGGLQVPRFAASLADGRVAGEGELTNTGQARGELLVSSMQAASLQRLLFPASLQQAEFTGQLDARLSLAAGAAGFVPRARVTLHGGSLKAADAVWPLDVASGTVSLDKNGAVKVEDFSAWSRGGRLSATGLVGPLPDKSGSGFAGKLDLANLRLGDLATLPGLSTLKTEAKADGLVSGSFDAVISQQSSLKGPARLRLATLFGLDVTELKTQLEAHSDTEGFRLTAADLSGRVEGADIDGRIEADTGKNNWHVRLKSTPVSTVRAARARSIRPETLPVRGDFSIDTDISGTLREANKFFPRPKDGFVKVATGPLTWRGRPLGSLNADLTAQDGLLVAKQFQLLRAVETGTGTPLITVSGRLPLAPDDPGLKAEVKLAEAPLDFVFEVMGEVSEVLKTAGISIPVFERVVDFVQELPPGATGKVSAEAAVTGDWRKPTIQVTSLTLRDARARVPAGGLSPPASLDAAFTYKAGAITISKAEFRLRKTSATPVSKEEEEDNDTLIQLTEEGKVIPDGPLQLSGQIVNANLAELATWIPALRGRDGRPILSGGLSEFTVTAGGTTSDPQIRGSAQAEKLAFDTYIIDTLRINRFDIRDGFLSIEPRAIALAKGNFRSITSLSGKLPWSWALPGPVRNTPMEVHIPFTQDDFALVGLVFPTLQAAEAEQMAGSIEIRGTLKDPEWSGSVSVKNGKFRLDPIQTALEIGVTELNGTLRFAAGNRLEIDADDPLRGRLVTARAVKAREVRRARREKDTDAPELDGQFSLKGGVTYDPVLANWLNPREAATRQKYDLTFTLENGRYSSPMWNGVHNAAAAIIWRTGPAPYAENQNLRWMFAADGNPAKTKGNGGSITSVGFLRLDPEAAFRPRRLGLSRALDFTGEEDFAGMAVAKRINLNELEDRHCQLNVNNLAIASDTIGRGLLAGRLVLDNRQSVQQAPEEAVNLRRVAFAERLRSYRKPLQLLGVAAGDRFRRNAQGDGATVPLRDLQPAEAREEEILRLGGSLTLSNASLGAVPAGGGIPVRLSFLPAAPLFDIRIVLGKEVTVAVSTLRATLDGTIIIGGTPQDPQVYGTLATIEGQVRFPSARARLEEGTITVSASRDPALDILQVRAEVDVTARGNVNTYEITLHVRGPLVVGDTDAQNLRVDVSSNPPLPESEAFAQLLGTSSRSATGAQTDTAYGRAVLQVLSTPLFSGVERSLATALGLTAINFDYRFDDSIAVEFSKNIGNRTIISYRRSIAGPASEGGQLPFEIRLDYRLKGNLLIGVQTDEQDVRKVTLQKTWRF